MATLAAAFKLDVYKLSSKCWSIAQHYGRRGNCHDSAVAESFFKPLKRERIKRNIYKTREHARQDVFDYIEMFYNPIRRHSHTANYHQ